MRVCILFLSLRSRIAKTGDLFATQLQQSMQGARFFAILLLFLKLAFPHTISLFLNASETFQLLISTPCPAWNGITALIPALKMPFFWQTPKYQLCLLVIENIFKVQSEYILYGPVFDSFTEDNCSVLIPLERYDYKTLSSLSSFFSYEVYTKDNERFVVPYFSLGLWDENFLVYLIPLRKNCSILCFQMLAIDLKIQTKRPFSGPNKKGSFQNQKRSFLKPNFIILELSKMNLPHTPICLLIY